ncbi:hypothetical protein SDIAM103S_05117 [Streptomyces diastaticus subsp. diastaticus]
MDGHPGRAGRSAGPGAHRLERAGGIGGFFERTFAPKGLARIHDQTLAKLAAALEK